MFLYLIRAVTQSVAPAQNKIKPPLGRPRCAPPRQNQEGKTVREKFSFGQGFYFLSLTYFFLKKKLIL